VSCIFLKASQQEDEERNFSLSLRWKSYDQKSILQITDIHIHEIDVSNTNATTTLQITSALPIAGNQDDA